MSRIQFQGEQVLRDGRSLHSPRDPAREAGVWVAGRPARVQGLVFVLGLGAGHHVREWARQRPDLTIVAIDFDQELFHHMTMIDDVDAAVDLTAGVYGLSLEHAMIGRGEALIDHGYSVVRFRPAWGGRETEFHALEDILLDRSILHLRSELVAGGAQAWPRGLDLNIKSLTAAGVEIVDLEDRKLLMALRELVA